MKKNISIFALTLIFAFIIAAIIFVFSGCQKDDDFKNEIHTEAVIDEAHFEFNERSGPLPIFFTTGVFIDSLLYQSSTVPRIFIEFNKHTINLITLTKIQGVSANINGVIHSGYKVEIDWKDNTPNYVIEKAYVAGVQNSYSYSPFNLDNSLIHISSIIKWKKVARKANNTLQDYYDDYYCFPKKNYLYAVTTSLGYSSDLRKNGATQNSFIYVPKNQ